MHVAALDRQARLSGIDERSPHRRARSHVHVGIVEHEHGIFPAQLQHHGKQALRRGRRDPLPGRNAAGENQLVDRRTQQRRSGRALADHDLKHILGHARRVQQRRQFQRHQRRQLRRLQHHGIARHQRRQRLRRRNRKRIIPRRNDSDHAMRFAHQPSALQLGDQIAVRHRLIAQQSPRVVDQKSRRVEHHQHFGDQRLDQRLAHFARDRRRNLRLLRVELRLKLAQDGNPPPQSQLSPCRLRRPRPRHRSLNFTFACALEFPQNFARRRIHRHDLPRRDL